MTDLRAASGRRTVVPPAPDLDRPSGPNATSRSIRLCPITLRLGATAALISRAYLKPGTTAEELEAAQRKFREAVAGCDAW